jgi:hypothetical protein
VLLYQRLTLRIRYPQRRIPYQVIMPFLKQALTRLPNKRSLTIAYGYLSAHLVPLRLTDSIATLSCAVAMRVSRERRYQNESRVDIIESVLGTRVENRRAIHATGVVEHLLDRKVYFCDAPLTRWPSLWQGAQAVARQIDALRRADPTRPVILSPFHYVSQYVNMVVCEALRQQLELTSMAVITAIPADMLGIDHIKLPHIRTLSSAEPSALAGLRLARELRRNGVAILFADVPPQSLVSMPMETTNVRLFGRAARVHNGVFRLGKPLDALLLPYYIGFSGRDFRVRTFDPIELAHNDAPQRLANAIETAFLENHAQWLPSDRTAFYYFCPEK